MVSAYDLRELTRDRRVHLGVVVADAERGRAGGAIQVPTTRRVVGRRNRGQSLLSSQTVNS